MKAYITENKLGEMVLFASETAPTETCEEVGDLEKCCVAGFSVFTEQSGKTTPDYITEGGDCFFAGFPIVVEKINIWETNKLMQKQGDLPFAEWDFNFWIGTYWDGHNWKVMIFDTDLNEM